MEHAVRTLCQSQTQSQGQGQTPKASPRQSPREVEQRQLQLYVESSPYYQPSGQQQTQQQQGSYPYQPPKFATWTQKPPPGWARAALQQQQQAGVNPGVQPTTTTSLAPPPPPGWAQGQGQGQGTRPRSSTGAGTGVGGLYAPASTPIAVPPVSSAVPQPQPPPSVVVVPPSTTTTTMLAPGVMLDRTNSGSPWGGGASASASRPGRLHSRSYSQTPPTTTAAVQYPGQPIVLHSSSHAHHSHPHHLSIQHHAHPHQLQATQQTRLNPTVEALLDKREKKEAKKLIKGRMGMGMRRGSVGDLRSSSAVTSASAGASATVQVPGQGQGGLAEWKRRHLPQQGPGPVYPVNLVSVGRVQGQGHAIRA